MTDLTILPNAHAAFVDSKGLPTRAAYTFFRNLQTAILQQVAANQANGAQIGDLQQQVSNVILPYWGNIAGDITDQEDLQAQFATKTNVAVVPDDAPTAGQILVGNAGATAYARKSLSGDATLASTGAITIANAAVSLAKMANLAAVSIIGNKTGGAATPAALSASDVRTLIGVLLASYATLPSGITPGASPYTYQNSGTSEADVLISGGTVSAVDFTRDNLTFYAAPTAGFVRLSPSDRVRVTYTVAPTMTLVPR